MAKFPFRIETVVDGSDHQFILSNSSFETRREAEEYLQSGKGGEEMNKILSEMERGGAWFSEVLPYRVSYNP